MPRMISNRAAVDGTELELINPEELGRPRGYSNGVLLPTGLLFVAGQVGWGPDERMTSDNFADQFDQALANVLAIVAAAGGRPESLARMVIYVTDKEEYIAQRRETGRRYRARMGKHYPAMTLVEVQALLEPGARVEIEAVAYISPGRPAGDAPA
jgi:enamine deaminase RidA (YjgF/YER057c/UK114 family)